MGSTRNTRIPFTPPFRMVRPKHPIPIRRRLRENVDRYQASMAGVFNWVDTEGPKHGIERSRRQ